MRQLLTHADVKLLLEEPSAENRREAAIKVAAAYTDDELSHDERRIAEDILHALARDVSVQVREALSENLKSFSGLPHDLALRMARDINSVALPVIEFSDVLGDDDLIEIARSEGVEKQTAVAKRETVSEQVSDALVDTGREEVVATLVENTGADISEKSFEKVLDGFGENERISKGIVHRPSLPITVSERLVNMVSAQLREELMARHDLPGGVASNLVMLSREKATIGLLSSENPAGDVQSLVTQLKENGRLTPSIILRAICMGDVEFFEVSISVLSRIPLGAARTLIHDEGFLGLPAIIQRAGLPDDMIPLFRTAVEVVDELEFDGGENDRERFRGRLLERILTQMEDVADDIGADNADYLLERLCGLEVPSTTQSWKVSA
jgi:uncharacterized protein (DUF2336 family)